jgi:KpsF/GutQ family protein
MDDMVQALRAVIAAEEAALAALRDSVDESWLNAVALMDDARRRGGRIVVCGVGKSGHVGRKIAASLASTGTPALFVHGTEASHGDLGMVGPSDAVLMITASGNTRELLDAARFCAESRIPLLLITRNPGGVIARFAQVIVKLPDAAEACPNGMAPTTSSTATLAAGDALMVALMLKADFRTSDFARLHPGGRLGEAVRRVVDVMVPAAALTPIGADASLREGLRRSLGGPLRIARAHGADICADQRALVRAAADAADLSAPLSAMLPAVAASAHSGEALVDVAAREALARDWGVMVLAGADLIGYAPAAAIEAWITGGA